MNTKSVGNAWLQIAMLSALCSAVHASERSDWKEAQRRDSVASYEQFIRTYPDSERIGEARRQLEVSRRIEQTFAWDQLRNSSDLSRLREFIKQYPDGLFVNAAQDRLVVVDYDAATASNTMAAYKKFLAEHPQSSQASPAREALARLTAQADEAAFALASSTGRYFDVLAYAQGFPNGAHATEIAAALANFKLTRIAKPTLLPWKDLVTTLVDAAALQQKMREKSFGSVSTMTLQGSQIQPLDQILFVAKDMALPYFKDTVVEPTTFRIDGGTRYLQLSTPGPNDRIRSVFPFLLVAVGSVISIGASVDITHGEARATVVGAAGPTGQSLTIVNDPKAVAGLVNLFGTAVRIGSLRVVEQGLELQPGTEILRKQ